MAKQAALQPVEGISDDVAALATTHRLGEHRETFVPKRHGILMVLNMLFLVVIGFAVFILPGILFLRLALRTPNFSRKQAAKRLHFFEHGLVVADHTGPVEAFRWESMLALQEIVVRYVNGIYVGTNYTYTLTRQDGSVIKLTQFYADPERWGAIIQQEITRTQAPVVLAALEQGQTWRFGDISVSKGGVATAKRGAVAWDEIQNIEVRNGVVYLRKAGKTFAWSNTQVKKIPNFFLFLAVVEVLRHNR